MEERTVQKGGNEEGRQAETPPAPGTTPPQYLTREDAEQLFKAALEEASRRSQGSADRRLAEIERRISEQSPQEEDEYDDLLAQAGYFAQPQQPQQPMWTQDPASGQWVQVQPDPYAQQRAAMDQRRWRKIQQEQRETAQVVEQERFIAQTLAEAGMTRAQINPYEYSREGFVAEVQRRTSEKAKATQEAEIKAEVERRVAEAKQELLQQDIDRGSYDQFQGGPAAVPPSGSKLERTVALNEAFNMGRIDAETFQKLKREIENE